MNTSCQLYYSMVSGYTGPCDLLFRANKCKRDEQFIFIYTMLYLHSTGRQITDDLGEPDHKFHTQTNLSLPAHCVNDLPDQNKKQEVLRQELQINHWSMSGRSIFTHIWF